MSFNADEYSKALNSFIIKAEQLRDPLGPEMAEATTEICRVLRVAKLIIKFYVTPAHEQRGEGDTAVLLDEGVSDPERRFAIREMTGGGNVAVYELQQRAGDEDWSEEERSGLLALEKLLFSFNGRARVMSMIDRLIYFDEEMGINNLKFFLKTVSAYIAIGKIDQYSACYFNLKRFSVINQNIGRPLGTVVMKKFVTELCEKLDDESECVCRIGGDNFAVLFLKKHTDSVVGHLKGTGIVYGEGKDDNVLVSAHAGFYMIPPGPHTPSEIMDNISITMNVAKNITKSGCVVFNEKLKENFEHIKMVESMFPDAIKNEEFRIFYQPKVYLKDYTLHGAEALCRWFRNGKMVPPDGFIPALEQSKLICALDFYMLEHTCRDIRRWLDEGRPVVKVSVNLSRRHLGEMYLAERILACIDKYKIPHKYIEIELTETTTDVNFSDLRKIVFGLKDAGISTSIDDFGMGYSSLNLIKELPWSVLKIDKSFLPDENDKMSQNYLMLKHIIALAQDIGLECIVEGVESSEHVRLLKENNCFMAQGFYFDRPMPVEQFEQRLGELAH